MTRWTLFNATAKRHRVCGRHYSSRPSLNDQLSHRWRRSHIGPITHTTNWRSETHAYVAGRDRRARRLIYVRRRYIRWRHQGKGRWPAGRPGLHHRRPRSGRDSDPWSRPNLQPSTTMSEFRRNLTGTRIPILVLADPTWSFGRLTYEGQFDCGKCPYSFARTHAPTTTNAAVCIPAGNWRHGFLRISVILWLLYGTSLRTILMMKGFMHLTICRCLLTSSLQPAVVTHTRRTYRQTSVGNRRNFRSRRQSSSCVLFRIHPSSSRRSASCISI